MIPVGQVVQVFTEVAFHFILQNEFENREAPDLNPIVVFQPAAMNSAAVDQCSIGAIEVIEEDTSCFTFGLGVFPAHLIILDRNGAVFIASEADLVFSDWEDATDILTGKDEKVSLFVLQIVNEVPKVPADCRFFYHQFII